jgi:hypothetical protein
MPLLALSTTSASKPKAEVTNANADVDVENRNRNPCYVSRSIHSNLFATSLLRDPSVQLSGIGLRRDLQDHLIFIRLWFWRRFWVWVLAHRPEFEAGAGPISGSFDQTSSKPLSSLLSPVVEGIWK